MIQIFGTKKCNDTKKAERFFKERNIKIQFIDMKEKGMSKGELNNRNLVDYFSPEEAVFVGWSECICMRALDLLILVTKTCARRSNTFRNSVCMN